jgi:hypothetical protein
MTQIKYNVFQIEYPKLRRKSSDTYAIIAAVEVIFFAF